MDKNNTRNLTAVRIPARDVALFTAMAALLAIFFDASLGHGMTWENDPYWTYWITKTFLIATVIGLGTAWFGVGRGRGAVIVAVHTLILTVYYWTLAPIGLPNHPEWLDLEHTWLTGLPIHFAVIYLGYLTALWIYRRRIHIDEVKPADPQRLGTASLVVGLIIVVVAGLLVSLVLGEFPGVTWFVVRLLITVPTLYIWWAAVGRDRTSSIIISVLLSLMWATYGYFLSPNGLPSLPLRIFNANPPPANVHWLTYEQEWLISFPIYLVVMLLVLYLSSGKRTIASTGRSAVTLLLLLGILSPTALKAVKPAPGVQASITTSGQAYIETGSFFSNQFETGTGDITVNATDIGDRVTPLPPYDEVHVNATIKANDHTYDIKVDKPMIDDPLGRFTTWWGVGLNVTHHGKSGIGTSALPYIHSDLALFGMGSISVDGKVIAEGIPVHLMTAKPKDGLANGATLEMDAGDPDMGSIVGLPDGHLRVLWTNYSGVIPQTKEAIHYLVGGLVLLVMLAAAFMMNRRVSS